jgi:predicted nuclease with RNAse H fold
VAVQPLPQATLGIDLAAQPRNTAACLIAWSESPPRIVRLDQGLDDESLVLLINDPAVSRIGVDAPFGWPMEFADAIASYGQGKPWTPLDPSRLRFRETDRNVRELTGRWPLSVATDLISHIAMRWARLVSRVAQPDFDKSGRGRFVEVYPAAALRLWRLDPAGYKGENESAGVCRESLLAEIIAMTRLEVSAAQRKQFCASDHSLDALLCALIARACDLGQVTHPLERNEMLARREGWIQIPLADSLNQLG